MQDSILDAVGSPLVKIASPEGATIAAKIEGFNPGGSAKDRPAREMIAAAERAGEISPARSAAAIISRAGRSLADPPGLNPSILAAIVAPSGEAILTRGDPTASRIESCIIRE